MSTTMTRANLQWVKTDNVIPNPLNPRRNDAIKTEEIQEIISRRGWEEPLTVYQRGINYVVMAGHRRLYAAKQLGIKQIPVFIVEAPENHQDEIERIASLQRGRVDWQPYEWAKFTYERWVAWQRPPLKKFAKQIGINERTVTDYITVLDYYPRQEVEAKLMTGTYHVTTLAKLAYWMRRLKTKLPDVVENLTEEMIRRTMLAKIDRGLINKEDLHADKFVTNANKEQMRLFLTTPEMSLKQATAMIGVSDEEATRSFVGHLTSIGKMNNRLYDMQPKNVEEYNMLKRALQKLEQIVKVRLEGLESEYKDLI